MESSKEKLLQYRNKRIRPGLDDKILLGWNALMITAYCKAYAATLNEHFKHVAVSSMQFLENNFQNIQEESWYHTYKNSIAKIPAFLDDYAYLIHAMIGLQEITGNQDYLTKAKNITQYVVNNFSENNIFFYYTHKQQTDVIVRKKEVYDGATPSGNGIMALNLQYLGIVFNESSWIERADQMVATLSNAIIKYPTSFGIWSSFLQQKANGIKEIVLTGKEIMQSLPITGAVVVSTPQAVALADAKKGVSMFMSDSINVPVLGIIENMAYFTPEELPENRYYIFGKEGARNLATDLNVPFLGEVPIVQSIREAGDYGRPAALQTGSIIGTVFENITRNVVQETVNRNESLPATEAIKITTMAGCSAVKK